MVDGSEGSAEQIRYRREHPRDRGEKRDEGEMLAMVAGGSVWEEDIRLMRSSEGRTEEGDVCGRPRRQKRGNTQVQI